MGAFFVSVDNVPLTWSVADVRMFDGHVLAFIDGSFQESIRS